LWLSAVCPDGNVVIFSLENVMPPSFKVELCGTKKVNSFTENLIVFINFVVQVGDSLLGGVACRLGDDAIVSSVSKGQA
jgi:hypothetical protein